jgi:hypothetical protein
MDIRRLHRTILCSISCRRRYRECSAPGILKTGRSFPVCSLCSHALLTFPEAISKVGSGKRFSSFNMSESSLVSMSALSPSRSANAPSAPESPIGRFLTDYGHRETICSSSEKPGLRKLRTLMEKSCRDNLYRRSCLPVINDAKAVFRYLFFRYAAVRSQR